MLQPLLEVSEKILSELKETQEEETLVPQEDWSEFVGLNGNKDLAIKGQKYLQSIKYDKSIDIIYGYPCINYNKTPKYEIVTMEDLKYGDVFVGAEKTPKTAELKDIKIFIGNDKNNFYINQYLNQYQLFDAEIERIDCYIIDNLNRKVKRFLRE
jgi:hypothetical protein